VRLGLRLHNDKRISNDEQGAPVWICKGLRASWRQLWPRFRDFG
jgi:hypothetical protein